MEMTTRWSSYRMASAGSNVPTRLPTHLPLAENTIMRAGWGVVGR